MWMLVIIGAVNWGLIGLFGLDVVGLVFGHMTFVTRIIYLLVGVSGVMVVLDMKAKCGGMKGCMGCDMSCLCGHGSCDCTDKKSTKTSKTEEAKKETA